MKQVKNKLIQSFAILVLLLICGILPIFNFNVYAAEEENDAKTEVQHLVSTLNSNTNTSNWRVENGIGKLVIKIPNNEYQNIGIQGTNIGKPAGSNYNVSFLNLSIQGGDVFTITNEVCITDTSDNPYYLGITSVDTNTDPDNWIFTYTSLEGDTLGDLTEDSIASIEPDLYYNESELNNLGGVGVEPEPATTEEIINEAFPQAGPFEMTISEMCLAVGDHLMEYLTFLLKEEVTIDKIIFNKVDALNANFFTNSENPSRAPATKFVRDAVNYWYAFLGKIVIIIYLIALIAVGIMIMLGGVSRKVNAQEILMKWTMGIVIFYFFPYIMKYAFNINEAILRTLEKQYGSTYFGYGSHLGGALDLANEEIEERSPEYVSRATYLLTLGSEEATAAHINRIETYKNEADLMRLMRALAGVTARMFFVILWFIMIYQLLAFIFIYYKRYLMIAFLIMVFPVTLISYVMGTVSTGKVSSLSSWCKEFFTNVFLQTIHAIIYGIITGVIVNQIKDALQAGDFSKINWLIWIVVINFVFTGEKILKGIMNAGSAESVKSLGDVAKSGRGAAGRAFGKVRGMFSK